jgi:hypothetical protein
MVIWLVVGAVMKEVLSVTNKEAAKATCLLAHKSTAFLSPATGRGGCDEVSAAGFDSQRAGEKMEPIILKVWFHHVNHRATDQVMSVYIYIRSI